MAGQAPTAQQVNPSAGNSVDVGRQKITEAFKPLFEELKALVLAQSDRMANQMAVMQHELLLTINTLEVRLETLERLAAGTKKKTPAAKAPADGTVPVLEGKLPVNKVLYFRQQWKTNQAFRDKYNVGEVKATIEDNAALKEKRAKQSPEAYITSEAAFAWNVLKDKTPAAAKEIEDEYSRLKEASKKAAPPPAQQQQETADQHSDDEADEPRA